MCVYLNFAVIACKPTFPAYAAALNPMDQIFDFEELEYHYLVANRTEDAPTKGLSTRHLNIYWHFTYPYLILPEDGEDGDSENEELDGDKSKEEKLELEIKPNSTTNKAILENPNIDNPYLRAATLPKRSKLHGDIVPPRIMSTRNPSSGLLTTTPSTIDLTKTNLWNMCSNFIVGKKRKKKKTNISIIYAIGIGACVYHLLHFVMWQRYLCKQLFTRPHFLVPIYIFLLSLIIIVFLFVVWILTQAVTKLLFLTLVKRIAKHTA